MHSMNPAFEYRTTFASIPDDFPNHSRMSEDLARICPKPPRGEDWQLVSSSTVTTQAGTTVLYFWERDNPNHRAEPR